MAPTILLALPGEADWVMLPRQAVDVFYGASCVVSEYETGKRA